MRTAAVVALLFAAGALATPVLDRRVLVTEEVVVTVTDYVTAGAPKASTKPVAVVAAHHGHYHPYKPKSTTKAAAPAPAPAKAEAPKAVAPAPKQSSTKVSVAPAPEPTSTSKAAAVVPTSKAAAPSPTTTAAPQAAVAAGSSDLPKTFVPNLDPSSNIYSGLSVQHHNVHRQNASAPDLTWNDTLAGYAKQTAQTCKWGHSL